MAAEVKSARRFYLLCRRHSALVVDGLEPVWKARQQEQGGTALPAGFPLSARLATAGYTTIEDLNGADATELGSVGFAGYEARAVLAALAKLI